MKSPLRILYLEDDPQDAELVQAMLEAEGVVCLVTRVETRADFLASLEQDGFDLILADYSLPSFDGISALKLAVDSRPELPFIFVSGKMGEEVAIEALEDRGHGLCSQDATLAHTALRAKSPARRPGKSRA